ncbi:MAG: pyridoxamine 5'-phosphate oxidase family protein [Chitinophagaceae bacterium]
MLPEKTIGFLKEKISDIRSALFSSLSSYVLKLPTTIVNTVHVDDAGQVWFFIQNSYRNRQVLEKEFPAQLDFYKKGKPFYLQITGKAWIIDDPEIIDGLDHLGGLMKHVVSNEIMLIKVQVLKADYFESALRRETRLDQLWKSACRWFFNATPGQRHYNLLPQA